MDMMRGERTDPNTSEVEARHSRPCMYKKVTNLSTLSVQRLILSVHSTIPGDDNGKNLVGYLKYNRSDLHIDSVFRVRSYRVSNKFQSRKVEI